MISIPESCCPRDCGQVGARDEGEKGTGRPRAPAVWLEAVGHFIRQVVSISICLKI